jgi:hypothetical protein
VANQIAANVPTFAKWATVGVGASAVAVVSVPAAGAAFIVFGVYEVCNFFFGSTEKKPDNPAAA